MGINPWKLGQIYGCDLYASATYMQRNTVIFPKVLFSTVVHTLCNVGEYSLIAQELLPGQGITDGWIDRQPNRRSWWQYSYNCGAEVNKRNLFIRSARVASLCMWTAHEGKMCIRMEFWSSDLWPWEPWPWPWKSCGHSFVQGIDASVASLCM